MGLAPGSALLCLYMGMVSMCLPTLYSKSWKSGDILAWAFYDFGLAYGIHDQYCCVTNRYICPMSILNQDARMPRSYKGLVSYLLFVS
jgi:hypothetical protein